MRSVDFFKGCIGLFSVEKVGGVMMAYYLTKVGSSSACVASAWVAYSNLFYLICIC